MTCSIQEIIAKIQNRGFQHTDDGTGGGHRLSCTERLGDVVVEKRFEIDDGITQLIVSFGSTLCYGSQRQVGVEIGHRYVKNKRGEITPKINDSINLLIATACRRTDFVTYRVLHWETIVLSVKNQWQMCDCWAAHEERCKDNLPEDSYHFVTFANACFTIFTDVEEGKFFTIHIEANDDAGHGAQNIEKTASEFRGETVSSVFRDKEPDNVQAVRLCVDDVSQFNNALQRALCMYAL